MNYQCDRDAPPGRRALLGAAADVLAEHGLDAPLELIAERAGVGPEAFSRDFPDRVALAVAALAQDVDELAERTSSWAGEADLFLWFVDGLADICVRHAAISSVMKSTAPDALGRLRRTIAETGGRVLQDAQMAGLVRADLSPDDVLTIASLLCAGLEGDLSERQAVSLRTREIVISGLRAGR